MIALNWNEIRVRAAAFARDHADDAYEKGEAQTFYNDFFEVFGIKRRRVAVFERQVKRLTGETGFIDLFWPGVLLAEQKSAGRDLVWRSLGPVLIEFSSALSNRTARKGTAQFCVPKGLIPT